MQMISYPLSQKATERFFELAAISRSIPPDVIEFIGSFQHMGHVDPVKPCIEHIILGLRHFYPSPHHNGLEEVAYVQYLGMKAYAMCDRLAETSVVAQFDYLLSLDPDSKMSMPDVRHALPVAPQLQEALWNSIKHWRKYYTREAIEAIGEYLVGVHVDHARYYHRMFRSEFIMACIWTATVDWAREYLEIYKSIEGPGYAAIYEAVSEAQKQRMSAIRMLADEEYARDWVSFLKWYSDGPFPDVDAMSQDFIRYPPASELLNGRKEKMLNDSLSRIF